MQVHVVLRQFGGMASAGKAMLKGAEPFCMLCMPLFCSGIHAHHGVCQESYQHQKDLISGKF